MEKLISIDFGDAKITNIDNLKEYFVKLVKKEDKNVLSLNGADRSWTCFLWDLRLDRWDTDQRTLPQIYAGGF